MKLVAMVVTDEGPSVFDGASLVRAPDRIMATTSAASAIAVVDPGAASAWLRQRGHDLETTELVDVRALMRASGRADNDDAIVRAASVPSAGWDTCEALVRAAHAIASQALCAVERAVMIHTTRENARGLRVDRARAAELADEYRAARETARRELQTVVPHLSDRDIRSEPAFRAALERRFGEAVTTTKLGSATGPIGHAIDARQVFVQFSKAAGVMQKIAAGPERVGDFLTFFGAHTGRFSSPGLGLHSLPKHPHPLLKSLVRQREVILPSVDRWFVARDLSAIEARVLALLAGEDAMVAQFRRRDEDADVYAWFAASVWPGVVIRKLGPNAHLRAVGKEAVLSLGFGVGVATFAERVQAQAPNTPEDDIVRAYDGFRSRFPAIQRAHQAALESLIAIATRAPVVLDPLLKSSIIAVPDALTVQLVTGRKVHYRNVRISVDEEGDHSVWFSSVTPKRRASTRMPVVRRYATEHVFDDGVARRKLAPHTLMQNIVQATARDILVHMQAELLRLKPELASVGFALPFTVHDAIVAESLAQDWAYDDVQAILAEVMGRVPATLPAVIRALPLASEPEEAPRERYG